MRVSKKLLYFQTTENPDHIYMYAPRIILLLFVVFCSSLPLAAQQTVAPDVQQSYVLSLVNKVTSQNRLLSQMDPDSMAALPFGIHKTIGGQEYVIAIDSSTFRPGIATFSAYMALTFPGATNKICFAAKNVAFNPKGVIAGPNTRLMLVSEHRISIGPKVQLVLKPDGYNYVEWDCNGFQAVNLRGYFEFDPGMIYPDPSAPQPDSVVRAMVQIHTNDVENMIVQTSIAPFCIRGVNDVVFTVNNATADFSEITNAPGMAFPQGYNLSAMPDPLAWKGFYMQQFSVKLPPQLAKNGQPPIVSATNLLIDNSGVSGFFQGQNLFSTKSGSMSGWGFSVTQLNVNIVSNHVNGAGMSGHVKLPVSENDSISYAAALSQNLQTGDLDFAFSIAPAANYKADVFSARFELYNTSRITVASINKKLKPSAELNGKISIDHNNAKAPKLEFQQLLIAADAPVLRGGTFSLVSATPDSTRLAGFRMTLTNIGIVQSGTAPALAFTVGLNFTDNSSNLSLGAGGSFLIKSKTQQVADLAAGAGNQKWKWEFDKVTVNNINLSYNSGPFGLNGLIQFKDNDPVYGNGFFGSIQFRCEPMSASASASVWFGNVSNYRYFYVDAAIPVEMPIGSTGLSFYRFMGGVYYHMRQPPGQPLENLLYTGAFGNALNYIPDQSAGLGLKAGITVGTSGSPRPANGDVAFEMQFNASGGINFIRLTGDLYCMIEVSQRQGPAANSAPIRGAMIMNYDFQNSTFHTLIGMNINLPSLTGSGQAVIHFEPNLWYVYVGRPQNRVSLNVANIATFTAYIEAGKQLDPMPPPPPNVTSILGSGNVTNQRNTQALENCSGFAFGAAFNTGFEGDIGVNNFEIYYLFAAGAGMDIMVLNYGPNAHCVNSTTPAGIKGWYAQGQIYAYLQGAVGARGNNFDVVILNLSAAAILQAKLPNPNWVAGSMGVQYDILGGLISGTQNFSFELGSQCAIIN
jgi:hypothetical protein